jgi:hypothetical protein
MHALIVSTDGEDHVFVGSLEKMETKAIEIVKAEIDLNHASWENFGSLEVEKLLLEAIEAKEVECVMELFSDISDVRGEMVFMRIVPAEIELDA